MFTEQISVSFSVWFFFLEWFTEPSSTREHGERQKCCSTHARPVVGNVIFFEELKHACMRHFSLQNNKTWVLQRVKSIDFNLNVHARLQNVFFSSMFFLSPSHVETETRVFQPLHSKAPFHIAPFLSTANDLLVQPKCNQSFVFSPKKHCSVNMASIKIFSSYLRSKYKSYC